MTKKEIVDFLLSKVDEDKKEAFAKDLKTADGLAGLTALLDRYGVCLTEEELNAMQTGEDDWQELTEGELDLVSGGCGSCDNYDNCKDCYPNC